MRSSRSRRLPGFLRNTTFEFGYTSKKLPSETWNFAKPSGPVTMTCWIWTLSPTFNAQGSPSRRTETCPVRETTAPAVSFESERGCAEHTIPVMVRNKPQMRPEIVLICIKEYIGLADATL